MSEAIHDLYTGRFDGDGKLITPDGTFPIFSSEIEDEIKVPMRVSVENEGQFGIIKGWKNSKGIWGCELIEALDPISSRLLGRLLKDSPELRSELLTLVRELRTELIGEPLTVVLEDESSLFMRPSGPKPVCAVVVGHRKSARGAEGKFEGKRVTEYDFHAELAEMIEEKCELAEVLIVFRENSKNGYSRLPGKINALNPDFVVSLHANAHNTRASGTETLYYKGSKNGSKLARAVQDALLKVMKLSDRKIKGKVKADRGGHLLSGTNAPAIIGEPFFIDNPSDLAVAVKRKEQLAQAYAKGIDSYAKTLSNLKASVTAGKVSKSDSLGSKVDLKFGNLTKARFLSKNKVQLLKLIAGVNGVLEEEYGAGYRPLNQIDFWVLFNSEAGLKNEKVDVNFRHSEGERGILPLPSNITFWNGPKAPAWDRPMPLSKNIEHFMLYLGQLKNKKVAKRDGVWLYQALFENAKIKDHILREARVLSGVVHGYFYSGNFSDKKVPVTKILAGFAKDQEIPKIMNGTTYVHANTKILVNREANIKDAVAMV